MYAMWVGAKRLGEAFVKTNFFKARGIRERIRLLQKLLKTIKMHETF